MMFDDNYVRQMCACVWIQLYYNQQLITFMYICIRGNIFAPVSTILPLYIAALLSNKLMFSEN
jgi:hypothetical protein